MPTSLPRPQAHTEHSGVTEGVCRSVPHCHWPKGPAVDRTVPLALPLVGQITGGETSKMPRSPALRKGRDAGQGPCSTSPGPADWRHPDQADQPAAPPKACSRASGPSAAPPPHLPAGWRLPGPRRRMNTAGWPWLCPQRRRGPTSGALRTTARGGEGTRMSQPCTQGWGPGTRPTGECWVVPGPAGCAHRTGRQRSQLGVCREAPPAGRKHGAQPACCAQGATWAPCRGTNCSMWGEHQVPGLRGRRMGCTAPRAPRGRPAHVRARAG